MHLIRIYAFEGTIIQNIYLWYTKKKLESTQSSLNLIRKELFSQTKQF